MFQILIVKSKMRFLCRSKPGSTKLAVYHKAPRGFYQVENGPVDFSKGILTCPPLFFRSSGSTTLPEVVEVRRYDLPRPKTGGGRWVVLAYSRRVKPRDFRVEPKSKRPEEPKCGEERWSWKNKAKYQTTPPHYHHH